MARLIHSIDGINTKRIIMDLDNGTVKFCRIVIKNDVRAINIVSTDKNFRSVDMDEIESVCDAIIDEIFPKIRDITDDRINIHRINGKLGAFLNFIDRPYYIGTFAIESISRS